MHESAVYSPGVPPELLAVLPQLTGSTLDSGLWAEGEKGQPALRVF